MIPKRKSPRKAAPTHRSGYEKKVSKFLKDRGIKFTYEEDKVPYTQPATAKKYIPDFKLANGIYIESKGRFTAQDRKKMSLVIEQNPDLDIRMLFMRNNYLRKGSKTRYSDWCDKKGIQWAVSASGAVPEEWLQENPKQPRSSKR